MCSGDYWGDTSVARFDHVELVRGFVSLGTRDDSDRVTDSVDFLGCQPRCVSNGRRAGVSAIMLGERRVRQAPVSDFSSRSMLIRLATTQSVAWLILIRLRILFATPRSDSFALSIDLVSETKGECPVPFRRVGAQTRCRPLPPSLGCPVPCPVLSVLARPRQTTAVSRLGVLAKRQCISRLADVLDFFSNG
jgi:hypothetical protein